MTAAASRRDQLNVESDAIVAGRNELERLLPEILAAVLPDRPA